MRKEMALEYSGAGARMLPYSLGKYFNNHGKAGKGQKY